MLAKIIFTFSRNKYKATLPSPALSVLDVSSSEFTAKRSTSAIVEARKEAEQFSVSPGNKRTEEIIPEAAWLKENRPADEHKHAQQKHVNSKLTATTGRQKFWCSTEMFPLMWLTTASRSRQNFQGPFFSSPRLLFSPKPELLENTLQDGLTVENCVLSA